MPVPFIKDSTLRAVDDRNDSTGFKYTGVTPVPLFSSSSSRATVGESSAEAFGTGLLRVCCLCLFTTNTSRTSASRMPTTAPPMAPPAPPEPLAPLPASFSDPGDAVVNETGSGSAMASSRSQVQPAHSAVENHVTAVLPLPAVPTWQAAPAHS